MKLRTIAACMLAFGVCPFVRAQWSQYVDFAAPRPVEEAQRHLRWCHADLERYRRVLTALQSPAEFLGSPLGDSELEEKTQPKYMRMVADWTKMFYDPQWDRSPIRFYTALVRFIDHRCQGFARQIAELRPPPPARNEEGPISVARDSKNRPIITEDLIRRYLKAEYSKTQQTGEAPRRAGNFTQFDYDDVAERIEWARKVKRSQGGESLVSTSAMREQFSDEEVRVLNRRWRDLDNAQNGRWDQVNW